MTVRSVVCTQFDICVQHFDVSHFDVNGQTEIQRLVVDTHSSGSKNLLKSLIVKVVIFSQLKMVKLTPELINSSMQYINPCRDRELDLRGKCLVDEIFR